MGCGQSQGAATPEVVAQPPVKDPSTVDPVKEKSSDVVKEKSEEKGVEVAAAPDEGEAADPEPETKDVVVVAGGENGTAVMVAPIVDPATVVEHDVETSKGGDAEISEDNKPAAVWIRLEGCRKLRNLDSDNGTLSDPYVKLVFGSGTNDWKNEEDVKMNDLNPDWNKSYKLELQWENSKGDPLKMFDVVKVFAYDFNPGASNDSEELKELRAELSMLDGASNDGLLGMDKVNRPQKMNEVVAYDQDLKRGGKLPGADGFSSVHFQLCLVDNVNAPEPEWIKAHPELGTDDQGNRQLPKDDREGQTVTAEMQAKFDEEAAQTEVFLETAAKIAEKKAADAKNEEETKATEEELTKVATQLNSMFRGNKDRKRVAEIKAERARAKAEEEVAEADDAIAKAKVEIEEAKQAAANADAVEELELSPETVQAAEDVAAKELAEAEQALAVAKVEAAEAKEAVDAAQVATEAVENAEPVEEVAAEFDDAGEEPVAANANPMNAEVLADEIVEVALKDAVSDVESF